jgi:hypothetical protein
MARNRGKKALYEVMSKARARQGYGKTLEQMHLKKTEEVRPAVKSPKPAAEKTGTAADWWKKPRIAQFNAGRFEFSVPYQVAIVLGMALLVLLLGSYRLGQSSAVPGPLATDVPGQEVEKADQESSAELATANMPEPASRVEYIPPNQGVPPNEDVPRDVEEEVVVPPKTKGNNVIILVQYGRYPDLVPVQEHFREHGIETEIDLRGGQYFLQTTEKYDNPATYGSDGFEAKKEIIRVGALYKGKAPADLETFEKRLFSDAYGKKVED